MWWIIKIILLWFCFSDSVGDDESSKSLDADDTDDAEESESNEDVHDNEGKDLARFKQQLHLKESRVRTLSGQRESFVYDFYLINFI